MEVAFWQKADNMGASGDSNHPAVEISEYILRDLGTNQILPNTVPPFPTRSSFFALTLVMSSQKNDLPISRLLEEENFLFDCIKKGKTTSETAEA